KRQEDRPQSAAEMAAALDATPEGGMRIEGTAPASAEAASPVPAGSAAAPAKAAAPPPAKAAAPPPAARAGGLPAPPAGRAPRAPEPTIVETATAIMRRHDLPAAPGAVAPADQTIVDAGAANASPAAANAPAAGEASSGRKPFVLDRRLAAVVGGAMACVVIAVLLGIARHRAPDSPGTTGAAGPVTAAAPSSAPASHPASTGAAAPAPGAAPSAGSPVEEARRLRHNGDWEQALSVLVKARHDTPEDADVDYLLA